MTLRFSRRFALSALAAAACGRQEAQAAPGFPCGVASGDVDSSSAMLWAVSEHPGPHRVRVWPREDETAARELDVMPADGGVLLVPIDALQPARWYSFQFTALDGSVRSDSGQFRTAPAPGSRPVLTFLATSCARQTQSLAPMTYAAEHFELDAFLCLGDAVYADGAHTLSEYRAKWRSGLTRLPNRQLRQATSLVATWDDHESVDNLSDRSDAIQVAAARAAFFEHQPMRRDAPERIWRSRRWGDTAEVFALDCRGERNHATGEYISRAQLDWLKQSVAASPARFKVILNSVPLSHYPGALYAALADDRWDGWPEQRRELIEFMDTQSGVLWLTGDFHMGVAGRLSLEGPGSTQVELACGPAGSNLPNPSLSYPKGPQFDFASSLENVVVLTLDPEAGTADARFITGDGRVLFQKIYAVP